MINNVFEFLKDELNHYLALKTDNQGIDKVFLKNVLKQDGTIDMETDALSMLLVNVKEEATMISQATFKKTETKDITLVNPDINLNLWIFLVANFTNYEEALKFISLVITFFQSKNVFSVDNSANFDVKGVEKLIMKLQTLNLEEQNHLWGMLGAKYLPSVLYKASVLTIQDDYIAAQIPTIETVNQFLDKS